MPNLPALTAPTTAPKPQPVLAAPASELNYRQLCLPPDQILFDTNQVRQYENEEEFAELVASIAAQGILQPLTVEPLPAWGKEEEEGERYRIVTGHRRLRAARHLGLAVVPCLVRSWPALASTATQGEGLDQAAVNTTAQSQSPNYQRLLAQLTENRARADTDPYDEAVALKTAKVLADTTIAEKLLGELGDISLPAPYPTQQELAEGKFTNGECLNLYEAYLSDLVRLLTDPHIAPRLPGGVVYRLEGAKSKSKSRPEADQPPTQPDSPQEAKTSYGLLDQALAHWETIEKACGLSKSTRAALIRLLGVPPDLVEVVRAHCPKPVTAWAVRSRLQLLASVPGALQKGVVEAVLAHTERGQLEMPLLERLVELLKVPDLVALTVSELTQALPHLVTLLLDNQGTQAGELALRYLDPETAVTSQRGSNPDLLTDQATLPNSDPSGWASDRTRQSGESGYPMGEPSAGSGAGPGQGQGRGRAGGSGYGGRGGSQFGAGEYDDADQGEEAGYWGGGLEGELDQAEGFEVVGLAKGELAPELALELQELGVSESGQLALATLHPHDQLKVVEVLRLHPHIKGKLRQIVKLMREEGFSLTAALAQILPPGWDQAGTTPASAPQAELEEAEANPEAASAWLAELPPILRERLLTETEVGLNPTMLSRIGKLESAQDRAALVEVLVANPTFEARTIYRLISQLAKGVPLSVAVEEALGQAPPAYVDTRSDEEKREEALAKFLIGVSDLIEGLDLLKALAPQGDLTQLPGPYQAQVVEAMGWVMTALEANQFTAHS